MARKFVTRKWAARARHAKIEAAPVVEQSEIDEPTETRKVPMPKSRDATAAARRSRVGDGQQTSGFAAIWAERSIGTLESPAASDGRIPKTQADSVVASEPAPAPTVAPRPVRVVSQEEFNEMDLAAASMAGSSDSFWLRGLFIVFGGLIAAGSALRLFV